MRSLCLLFMPVRTVQERAQSRIKPGNGLQRLPTLYINADEIAEQENINAGEAAVKAEERRARALRAGVSFVMETVMSTPSKLDFMKEAKARGYRVHLEYITTQNHRINLDRVRSRVQKGGHDVPEEKITARYKRSMDLLPEALKITDTARVYNNSFEVPFSSR